MRTLPRAFLLALLVAWPLIPERALAQDGFHLTPTLTVAQVYDDDLSPQNAGPTEALISRLTPQLAARYGSERLTLLARGMFDSEVFDSRPERIARWARRMGELQFHALATKRLTASAGATYWDTETPKDLTTETGFDPGLVRTQSLKVSSSVAYRLTELSEATVAYDFNRTAQAGLLTDTQALKPGINGQLTQRDAGRLDVLVRRLTFHNHLTLQSVVPLLGWAHQVTPQISFALLGGPRFTNGVLEDAEASASIRQDLKTVHASLTYARTQTALAGLLGTVNTQSVSAAVLYESFDRLSLSVASAAFVSAGGPLEAKIFQLRVDATYPVTAWMAIVGTYRYSLQRVSHLDVGQPAGELAYHNLLSLGVSIEPPSERRHL